MLINAVVHTTRCVSFFLYVLWSILDHHLAVRVYDSLDCRTINNGIARGGGFAEARIGGRKNVIIFLWLLLDSVPLSMFDTLLIELQSAIVID